MICYYCGKELSEEDMVIKKYPMVCKNGKVRNYSRKLHYDCVPKYNAGRNDFAGRSEEASSWDRAYKTFRTDILGLDDDKALSEHAVKRLLGLRVGRYYPNGNNTRILKRGYDFDTIYYTIVVCTQQIQRAFDTQKFKDQDHKINFAMKIITNNIDFVQKSVDQSEKQAERVDKIDVEIVEQPQAAEYKRRGTGKARFADIE